MNDMSAVIIPKSDQTNTDDLLAGPRTITIREVTIRPGTEQPVSIHYEGDGGKPWKPCKSMSRVLVAAWGPDANKYVGRSATLYGDPKVKWGGMQVGGIRISHLSHIEREMLMALTETKGKRVPFIVKPLAQTETKKAEPQTANGGDPMAGNGKQTETVGFMSWDGNPHDFPRNLAGIEQYATAFQTAFAEAVDKAAWFADNEKLFHELALGAVGSRGKSARCEKLAALFDAISTLVNDTLAGAA